MIELGKFSCGYCFIVPSEIIKIMAKGYSLATYVVRIKNKITHSNVSLNSSEIGGESIFSIFSGYFTERNNQSSNDNDEQKILRVARVAADEDLRIIKGIIETGEYGIKSEFFNVETQETSIERGVNDAEMLPFYFLLSIPEGSDEAIIILQRFNVYGIKTALQRDLQNYFKEFAENYSIYLFPLIYESVLNEYVRGDLKEIRLVKFTVPKNIENAYDRQGLIPNESFVELVVRAKRNVSLKFAHGSIVAFLKNLRGSTTSTPLDRVIEVDGFDYDTIKVNLEINGKRRIMDLSNPYAIASYYDITKEVETENGIPIFRSIDAIAQNLLEEHETSLSLNQ